MERILSLVFAIVIVVMAFQVRKLYFYYNSRNKIAPLSQLDKYTVKSLITAILLQITCKGSEFFLVKYLSDHKMMYVICNFNASIGTWVSFAFIYLLLNLYHCDEEQKTYKSGSLIRISLCWLVSLPWAILPLFGYGAFIKSGNSTFFGPPWASGDPYDKLYFILMYTLGFIIPLAYFAIVNWRIEDKQQRNKNVYFIPQPLLLDIILNVVILWIPFGCWGVVKMIWGNISEPTDLVVLIIANLCYVITPVKLSYHLKKF